MTVAELITLAMKRVNILSVNQSISADDLDDGLSLFNLWLDSLSIQSITIPFLKRSTFPIVSGTGTYTVGPTGDIAIVRPTIMDHVNYIDASLNPSIERELSFLTDDAYAAIPIKTLTNPLPSFYYWKPYLDTDPSLGSLFFWLTPTSSVLTGVLYYPLGVPVFTAGTDTINVPNGWKWFMQENLAVYYGQTWRENIPVDQGLIRSATDAKLWVQRNSSGNRTSEMTIDPALTLTAPRSNIYTGQP